MFLLYITLIMCFGVDAYVPALEHAYIPLARHDGSAIPVPVLSASNRVAKQQAPWHAGIYKKTTKPYMQICGGTVVTLNAVITAAHCFSLDRHMPPATHFAVAAGKIYRPWNEPHDEGVQKSDVKAIRVPPRYQGNVGNFQDDIAVVSIVTEFYFNRYVAPACLNFNSTFDEIHLQDGHFGQVVGWGLTGENSPSSQVLLSATLPTVSIEKCIEQSPVSFRSSITGDKICAGYNNGTAVCRGDSGGGLVFHTIVNYRLLAFLRGVASTSPATKNLCNIYTWATFTHLLKHEHFVKSVVPDVEQTCALYYLTGFEFNQRLVNVNCCKCPKIYNLYYGGIEIDMTL